MCLGPGHRLPVHPQATGTCPQGSFVYIPAAGSLLARFVLLLPRSCIHVQVHSYQYKDVNREIEDLERDLKDQLKSNEQLLISLRSLKKKVIETGKSIDNLMESDPSGLNVDHPKFLAINSYSKVRTQSSQCRCLHLFQEMFPITFSRVSIFSPTSVCHHFFATKMREMTKKENGDIVRVGLDVTDP